MSTIDHKSSSSVACRPLELRDLARVHELHEGHSFELPDAAHPLVMLKECVEVNGKVVAIGIARLELNVTLLLDHDWATPQDRLEAVRQLQNSMKAKASQWGIDWAHAEVPERWGKRLEELGWQPARNRMYYLRID